MFRQWFTLYARTPVEEDARAVGGQVEYLLAGKAFTAQDVLAGLSPDERTMTPIVSDQERSVPEALPEQFSAASLAGSSSVITPARRVPGQPIRAARPSKRSPSKVTVPER